MKEYLEYLYVKHRIILEANVNAGISSPEVLRDFDIKHDYAIMRYEGMKRKDILERLSRKYFLSEKRIEQLIDINIEEV